MSTRPACPRTGRGRLGAAAATLVTATALSGCQLASPITTDLDYDPADGVSVTVGEVEVLDLLVVSTGNEEPGIVAGTVVNNGPEPVTVSIQLEDRTELEPPVEVPPGGLRRLDGRAPLGDPGEPVVVASVPELPGSYFPLRVVTSEGSESTLAPIWAPDGPYAVYAEE